MKTSLTSLKHPACLSALALAAALTATSHASISLTGGTVTETFTTLPPASSWSTFSLTGAGANISNNATADTRIQAITSGTISGQLGTGAGAVALAATSLWYSGGFVATPPTGTDGSVLLVTLTNNTGSPITSLRINYDLGLQNGNVVTAEAEFAGHRVYWSLTGAVNSWNPIASQDATNANNWGYRGTAGGATVQSQPFSLTAPVATWAAGTNAFVLWLDDNAAVGTDGFYTLDNIAFTPTVVPEPTAGLLALGACGVFGLVRRRVA